MIGICWFKCLWECFWDFIFIISIESRMAVIIGEYGSVPGVITLGKWHILCLKFFQVSAQEFKDITFCKGLGIRYWSWHGNTCFIWSRIVHRHLGVSDVATGHYVGVLTFWKSSLELWFCLSTPTFVSLSFSFSTLYAWYLCLFLPLSFLFSNYNFFHFQAL